MPVFSNIDGEESASVTFTVAAISLTRNSSAELQEILCLGDPEVASSLGLARVVNTAPASTMAGLVVRVASGPSSLADFAVRAVLPSTATDNPVTMPSTQSVQVKNSTIGDLLASVQQNSTVWAVQADGRVRAQNSTIGDLLASVQQNSTVWQTQAAVRTSSGGGVEGSTTAPAVGVIGLHTRQVFPTMQSTTISITSTHSTAIYSIVSSVAALRHKVYAYFVGSTHTNPSTLIFCSSLSNSGLDHWHVNFGSGSSGITGANMALTPPGFIFGGVTANALNIKIEGGSSVTATCVARVSLGWFDEA